MTGQIFISYRREDSPGSAGRLYDRLKAHFNQYQIFIDVDTITPGEDFVEVIESAVQSCNIFIAVIGNKWLHITGKNGKRMLDNPSDFVGIEIRSALRRNIKIIPVLVENASMPDAVDLPQEIKGLAHRNAIEISHTRFNTDADRLIKAIEKIMADAELSIKKKDIEPKPKSPKHAARDAGEAKPVVTTNDHIEKEQHKTNTVYPGNNDETFGAETDIQDNFPFETAKNPNRTKYILLVAGALVLSFLIWKFTRPGDGGSQLQEAAEYDKPAEIIDSSKYSTQSYPDTTKIDQDKNPAKKSPTSKVTNDESGTAKVDNDKKISKEFTPPKIVKDESEQSSEPTTEDDIFTSVEREAQFPGGPSSWVRYIEGNLNSNIPVQNNAPAGTYRVIVKFVVNKDGSISEATTQTNNGFGMEQEAIRVIKGGPKWVPASQNGRNVRAFRLQPVVFLVRDK